MCYIIKLRRVLTLNKIIVILWLLAGLTFYYVDNCCSGEPEESLSLMPENPYQTLGLVEGYQLGFCYISLGEITRERLAPYDIPSLSGFVVSGNIMRWYFTDRFQIDWYYATGDIRTDKKLSSGEIRSCELEIAQHQFSLLYLLTHPKNKWQISLGAGTGAYAISYEEEVTPVNQYTNIRRWTSNVWGGQMMVEIIHKFNLIFALGGNLVYTFTLLPDKVYEGGVEDTTFPSFDINGISIKGGLYLFF